ISAGAQGALREDCFLKGRIHKNEQAGFLNPDRLYEFQTVARTEAQSCDQQLRLGFRDLTTCITNVVRLTAYQQVRLSVQKICDPVAKQRMLFQDQDSSCDGSSWNARASLSRLFECQVRSFQ